jgi:hypothetical protein
MPGTGTRSAGKAGNRDPERRQGREQGTEAAQLR